MKYLNFLGNNYLKIISVLVMVLFLTMPPLQAQDNLQIVIDGLVFESTAEYRAYRKEQQKIKAHAEAQVAAQAAFEAKKEAQKEDQGSSDKSQKRQLGSARERYDEDDLPPLRGDNPFIAGMPDESSWKTIILDPDAEEAHQRKIVHRSVEGQFNKLKDKFEKKLQPVENKKIKKNDLGNVIAHAATDSEKAIVLMSDKQKLGIYQHDVPESEPHPVDQHQAIVPSPLKQDHPAIFEELY